MRQWLLVLVGFAAFAALPPQPSLAVIGGQPDGNAHPNVGLIATFDEFGGGIVCTGTLVAPSTVLTNAHCVRDDPDFPPALEYQVSFESQARLNPPPAPFVLKNPIEGAPDPHPDWTWEGSVATSGAAAFYRYQETDVGLLHLERPAAEVYPGITPAPIVGPGALDALKAGKTTVTQVGYGIQKTPLRGPGEVFVDGSRNQSVFPLQKLRDTLAFNHANPNDSRGYGTPCAGDSGSPWFFNGTLGVVFSFAWSRCHNLGGGPRLDTGPARAFLRSRGLVP